MRGSFTRHHFNSANYNGWHQPFTLAGTNRSASADGSPLRLAVVAARGTWNMAGTDRTDRRQYRSSAVDIIKFCVEAIRGGELIRRVSSTDKEFHFQNWFKARLKKAGQIFEIGGRNRYPDFRMVATTDGYELKGLAYPGRDASFDSNSQPSSQP